VCAWKNGCVGHTSSGKKLTSCVKSAPARLQRCA
jgi:hypothetical protein